MKNRANKILEQDLEIYPELSKRFDISPATNCLPHTSSTIHSNASGEYCYLAFISYSHLNDDWGKWIHKSLESFRIPSRLAGSTKKYGVVPKKVYPIFRDRDELSPSAV